MSSSTAEPITVVVADDPARQEAVAKLQELETRALSLEERRSALTTGAIRPGPHGLRFDFEELSAERHTLQQQIAEQRMLAERLIREWSERQCQALRPMHRAIARRIARALRELDNALESEREFRDKLTAAGVHFATLLPPLPFAPGSLRDRSSAANAWFDSATAAGLLDGEGGSR